MIRTACFVVYLEVINILETKELEVQLGLKGHTYISTD